MESFVSNMQICDDYKMFHTASVKGDNLLFHYQDQTVESEIVYLENGSLIAVGMALTATKRYKDQEFPMVREFVLKFSKKRALINLFYAILLFFLTLFVVIGAGKVTELFPVILIISAPSFGVCGFLLFLVIKNCSNYLSTLRMKESSNSIWV